MAKLKSQKSWSYIGRAVISAVIFLYLLNKVDFVVVRKHLASLKLEYIYISLVPLVLEMILKSLKWQMLLKVKNIRIPFMEIFKIYYVSSFLGMFLPSSLGIDFLRTYGLFKQINNANDSISSVFIDRILGILSLLFVVFLGILAIKTDLIGNATRIVIVIGIILVAILGTVLLFRHVLRFLQWLSLRFKIKKFDVERSLRILQEIYTSIISFKENKLAIFKVFIVSIFFQMNRIAITYILALALNINIDIIYWIIIVPLVTLATMIPFAIGGIGIREGAFIFFLGKLGVSFSNAFLLSLVIFILGVFTLLPGLFLYLRSGIGSPNIATTPQ
jgi:uncharacterized protein (TIRG00374 family)